MSTVLTDSQRTVVVTLATAILPGTETHPSALEIGIDSAPIERALKSRPDLVPQFCNLLDQFHGDAESFLRGLKDGEFDLLLTLICAAYVMDEKVKKALGYFGQQALTPNRGGFGAEELAIEMMEQPKRFRDV
jgi:hypothetical protein